MRRRRLQMGSLYQPAEGSPMNRTPILRQVRSDGWVARLDVSAQRLAVEVPEFDHGSRAEEPSPRLALDPGEPVGAAVLIAKAKQFDDGLMATVELAASAGLGRLPGKGRFLADLAAGLGGDAAAVVLAACELGNHPAAVPAELAADVRRRAAEFLADDARSKPLGFYPWTPDLVAAFRRDRFLQTPLPAATAAAVAAGLECVPDGRANYAKFLRLAARLTNPFMAPALTDPATERAIFPPSWTPEVRLFQQLLADRPVPAGFELMGELIGAVRRGGVSLRPVGPERLRDGADTRPVTESGWYDHQMWALEPLAAPQRSPEGARHEFGPRYRRHLEDLFRGAAALTRETHVKQAGGGYGGSGGPTVRPIFVGPGLTVEPVPTVYARRAAAYRFVREVLDEAFGPAWQDLHRLTADGPVAEPLGSELAAVELLFAGAAATSFRELGIPAVTDEFAEATFAAWRTDLAADPDLGRDVRCVVPVFHDIGRRRTKVWAVLGWRTVRVGVSYLDPPTVLGVAPVGRPATSPPPVVWTGASYTFAEPVTAEVYVDRVPDRAEFRDLCRRVRTRDRILAHLVGADRPASPPSAGRVN